jgi:hypothetical protein
MFVSNHHPHPALALLAYTYPSICPLGGLTDCLAARLLDLATSMIRRCNYHLILSLASMYTPVNITKSPKNPLLASTRQLQWQAHLTLP